MPKRPQYHHGDLRAALLDAARAIVLRGDAQQLSLRKLARDAGVSSAAPYHHFKDRPSLFATLAVEGFDALDAALNEACTGLQDAEHVLATSCARYVTFAIEHAAHYRLMFSRDYADPDAFADYHDAAQRSFGTLMAKVSAVRPGSGLSELFERTTAIWAMAHGMVQLANDDILGSMIDTPALARRAGRLAVEVARGRDADGPHT